MPSGAAKPSRASSDASAGMPRAMPAVLRRKKWRRVMESARSCPSSSVSGPSTLPRSRVAAAAVCTHCLRNRFIQIQDDARPRWSRRPVLSDRAVDCFWRRQPPAMSRPDRCAGGNRPAASCACSSSTARSCGIGSAPRGQPEGIVDPARWSLPALRHHARGEKARGLHISRIVQQHQRLERRIGHGTARRALLPVGSVESDQRRRRHGAFPNGIHAAPVEVPARGLQCRSAR